MASMISIVFPPSWSSSSSEAREVDAIAREVDAAAREDAAARARVRNMMCGKDAAAARMHSTGDEKNDRLRLILRRAIVADAFVSFVSCRFEFSRRARAPSRRRWRVV